MGARLVKLDSSGNLQWQKAYSGGTDCFFNGFSETCTDVGGFAYSLHQTPDGGYVMAGDANVELSSGAPIVPWLAKTDAGGNLLWQHDYYQTLNGNPLSEDFSAAAAASDGGFAAVGNTEDYQAPKEPARPPARRPPP